MYLLRTDRLFVWTIQILVKNLGHGEHVHSILLEDGTHGVVATNLTSITWVLQLILTNVLPDLFDRLGP